MGKMGDGKSYSRNSETAEFIAIGKSISRRLPAGSPEPRSNISANIRAVKKLGTALERARRAAFKSVEAQR